MATGLIALLDDIAMIAKLAASSLDDVAGAAGKAGAKAAGVVIDDAAVTPNYVIGLTPERELPIIGKIAAGSLRNKLLFLLPAALLMSAFAPWLLTPLLMLGGSYLAFEAVEKIIEAFSPHDAAETAAANAGSAEELEKQQVSGAIRTDFILSGEIMAIALAEVANQTLLNQAIILTLVAVVITVGVYGVVGLIVKMDDIGLHMARSGSPAKEKFGNALVHAMPAVLSALSTIGTAAMLWVGGGIILHGLSAFGLGAIPHGVEAFGATLGSGLPALAGGTIAWLVFALASALCGLIVGGVIVAVLHRFKH